MDIKLYNLFIPTSFDIVAFSNKFDQSDSTIILYNKFTSIIIYNKNKKIKIDIENYSLKLTRINELSQINSFNEINKFLKTFELYFFIKIKFKGKGFKIKFNKKLKLIKFYFGRSHITFYKLKKIKLKKVTKYKFLLKNSNKSELHRIASRITYIKPVNLYTLRGIRVSRQFISKRKGKKSSYV